MHTHTHTYVTPPKVKYMYVLDPRLHPLGAWPPLSHTRTIFDTRTHTDACTHTHTHTNTHRKTLGAMQTNKATKESSRNFLHLQCIRLYVLSISARVCVCVYTRRRRRHTVTRDALSTHKNNEHYRRIFRTFPMAFILI